MFPLGVGLLSKHPPSAEARLPTQGVGLCYLGAHFPLKGQQHALRVLDLADKRVRDPFSVSDFGNTGGAQTSDGLVARGSRRRDVCAQDLDGSRLLRQPMLGGCG